MTPKTEIPRKKVAIIQSNYVPWVGYFSIMANVDLFLVYECVQYTKNDWRNRNQIETKDGGRIWLSIPVRQERLMQPFMETRVIKQDWPNKHFETLRHVFARSPGWSRHRDHLYCLYQEAGEKEYLYEVNRMFMAWIISILGIKTEVVYLESHPQFNDANDRLISVLRKFGATDYLSGPSARSYIDERKFLDSRISLDYVDYDKLIGKTIRGVNPVKRTSILQLILEGEHEFESSGR